MPQDTAKSIIQWLVQAHVEALVSNYNIRQEMRTYVPSMQYLLKFRYCEKKAKKFVKLVDNVKTKCEIFFKFFWLSQNIWSYCTKTIIDSYFRENSIPTENDSENCDPTFCQSTSSSKTDQCSNIRTRSNKFFVLVNAHGAYTNGVLSFSGSNLLNVKSYQMSWITK